MLKLGEIFLVSTEGAVDERKSRKAIFVVVHWRSMEVASHCSASRECMLIIFLNDQICTTKVG